MEKYVVTISAVSDDNTRNDLKSFVFIHFGSENFPDWASVLKFFLS